MLLLFVLDLERPGRADRKQLGFKMCMKRSRWHAKKKKRNRCCLWIKQLFNAIAFLILVFYATKSAGGKSASVLWLVWVFRHANKLWLSTSIYFFFCFWLLQSLRSMALQHCCHGFKPICVKQLNRSFYFCAVQNSKSPCFTGIFVQFQN